MLFGGLEYTTIDIGVSGIKVIRMKKHNSDFQIMAAGYRRLSQNVIKDGKIYEMEIVVSNLNGIFQEMNFKPKNLILTIPSQNLVVRNLELPLMEATEMVEAVKWGAEDYLPFPVEEAAIDYLLNRQEDKNNVLLIAIKKDILDNYLIPLHQLSLKPTVVNIQPMALISLLEFQGKGDEISVIIDIGASGSRVIIGDKDKIYLSRSIDTGGENFTLAIMNEHHLGYKQAEEYKLEHGLLADKETKILEEESDFAPFYNDTDFPLATLADQLAGEIARSLNYFAMNYRDKNIKQVYLTGGSSRLKGLQDIINDRLEQNTVYLDSLNQFNLANKLENGPDYSVAIGLGISEVLPDAG